mmetsp:Transcript_17513/g.30301  ORF Transcript_17513/g.30301 Transcript_17513/m.30301 type:complete len:88 (+) Transcript_17513:145-408(+)
MHMWHTVIQEGQGRTQRRGGQSVHKAVHPGSFNAGCVPSRPQPRCRALHETHTRSEHPKREWPKATPKTNGKVEKTGGQGRSIGDKV